MAAQPQKDKEEVLQEPLPQKKALTIDENIVALRPNDEKEEKIEIKNTDEEDYESTVFDRSEETKTSKLGLETDTKEDKAKTKGKSLKQKSKKAKSKVVNPKQGEEAKKETDNASAA